jgi:hypothetical protein
MVSEHKPGRRNPAHKANPIEAFLVQKMRSTFGQRSKV